MTTQAQYQQLQAAGYNLIPVYRQRLADTETPLSVFARLKEHEQAYLFESVEGGENWARYSIIGLGESTVFSCNEGRLTIQQANGELLQQPCSDPFQFIRDFQAQFKVPTQADLPALPSFTGGLVGYFGYDAVRYIEPRLNNIPDADPVGLPDIWMMLSKTVIVFDNLKDTLFLIVHADSNDADAYQKAQAQLDALEQLLATPVNLQAQTHMAPHFESLTGHDNFIASVEKVKEYIRAGDVMQVVPGHRMVSDFDGEPLQVYRALRHLNPSPYLFLVQGRTLDNNTPFHIVGSSPEILSRLENGIATVRPLAGTRPRGKTKEEDLALEKDLLSDEKEIAEHLMLIDLGRNDVGRVSKIGKVQVTDQMVIERYSHVMHIVSNVQGEVRDDVDALDVFKATFPAGTLSGAPKIRAMEIIDEVEPVKRGIFGGAVGYLGWHGEMDMSIAIRTCVIRENKVYVQAGAGLVADSNPESEWNETQIKARAVIKAVELSSNGLIL
ncbi:anthranilate synthase component I [Acinetobacter indicus]|jgi:anthranilate synthase component 1|uniref:anthranilate synthase component I n=1 Tax=Acinetobacter TaxID=469 RepID=UPI0002CE6EFC|nr:MULTISPECIES: anthranilate synthase component I [Acinetobacter]ENW88095.1 anthranilate synthase component 1 [Acinetobacter sp. CIP 53.82]MBA0157082.1 anthranilate synthase component I [Acinetobacter indicus]MCP0917490.1 anthranilate synthase component I [Acinetobacter indicus]MCP0920603.1 anthranilate synthase component I [Acinetobacter indicus]MCP0923270.1 anthranilate synthase component I [Acinetobacter indicus]